MSIEPFPGDCGVLEAGCASSFPRGATAGTRGLGRRGGGSREHSVLLSAFHIKTRNNPYFFTSNFFIFIIQFCQAGVLVSAAITNCHKLGGLKKYRNLLSDSFGGQKSELGYELGRTPQDSSPIPLRELLGEPLRPPAGPQASLCSRCIAVVSASVSSLPSSGSGLTVNPRGLHL